MKNFWKFAAVWLAVLLAIGWHANLPLRSSPAGTWKVYDLGLFLLAKNLNKDAPPGYHAAIGLPDQEWHLWQRD